jgi:Kef-type K+ transport system membrane component KefB
MKRPLALALVMAVVYFVHQVRGEAGGGGGFALAVGFALLAAALAGEIVERLRLPRLTGYLLFGFVCGPYVMNLISGPMARELRVLDGLAVALIAVIAGLEINLTRLRPRLVRMLQAGGTTIAVLYTALFAILYAAWPWLPIQPEATGGLKVAIVALLAAVVTSFSPTVTIAVIAEDRAEGPLTELTLAVVILGDLLLVLIFGLSMQLARWATSNGAGEHVGLFAHLSWDILGSIAFGALVGAVFALYLRTIGREVALVLLTVCVALSELGAWLRFEPVLAAVAAGFVVENIAPPRGDALKEAVERSALPVLIVFFVAAGASLRVDALREIGFVAVVLAVIRLGLIRAGTAAGARVAGLESPLKDLLWRGLVSQAGLTVGLTVIIATTYPDWGVPLQTLTLALIALHVVIGPILFRSALARVGEIGKGGR